MADVGEMFRKFYKKYDRDAVAKGGGNPSFCVNLKIYSKMII